MGMLQEGGNSENPSNLSSSQQLSYIAGLLDHACAFDASLLRGVRTQVILECTYVSKDSIIQACGGLMRGIMVGDIFLMYHTYIFFGARGGNRGTNICDVMFCRTPGVGTILLGNRRYTQN